MNIHPKYKYLIVRDIGQMCRILLNNRRWMFPEGTVTPTEKKKFNDGCDDFLRLNKKKLYHVMAMSSIYVKCTTIWMDGRLVLMNNGAQ